MKDQLGLVLSYFLSPWECQLNRTRTLPRHTPTSGGSPFFLAALLAREMLMVWDGRTVLLEQSTNQKEADELGISNLNSWLGNQGDAGQAIVGCWEALRMWGTTPEMGTIP